MPTINPHVKAFADGMRWALDHQDLMNDTASTIEAAIKQMASTRGRTADFLTEFGLGAATVRDAINETKERYADEQG